MDKSIVSPFLTHGVDCVDIARRSSARGRQTMVSWQKQVFIHTRLSCAYLALARLSCSSSSLANWKWSIIWHSRTMFILSVQNNFIGKKRFTTKSKLFKSALFRVPDKKGSL